MNKDGYPLLKNVKPFFNKKSDVPSVLTVFYIDTNANAKLKRFETLCVKLVLADKIT